MANSTQNYEERLKAALWYSIGKIVDDVAVEQTPSVNAAPTFIAGLTEMVSAKIGSIATDMEAFSRHAGRTVIDEKDAILLARHNESFKSVLQQKAERVHKRETK